MLCVSPRDHAHRMGVKCVISLRLRARAAAALTIASLAAALQRDAVPRRLLERASSCCVSRPEATRIARV